MFANKQLFKYQSACMHVFIAVKSVAHIDGLAQEKRNSITNALGLRLFCNNPSILRCKVLCHHPREVHVAPEIQTKTRNEQTIQIYIYKHKRNKEHNKKTGKHANKQKSKTLMGIPQSMTALLSSQGLALSVMVLVHAMTKYVGVINPMGIRTIRSQKSKHYRCHYFSIRPWW